MFEPFDSGAWAAHIKRITERESLDSLDVDKVLKATMELNALVGKWGVFKNIQVKVARAWVERLISPTRVGEIIEAIIVRLDNQRRLKLPPGHPDYISNPGGYFVKSVKDEFARAGIPWSRRDARGEDR